MAVFSALIFKTMFSQQSFQTAKTSSRTDVYNYRQLDEKSRLHLSVRILVLFLFDVIPTCGPSDEVAQLQLLRITFHGHNRRKRVLICFHSLIIYLTFQHHYSPNCKLYTHTHKTTNKQTENTHTICAAVIS